MKRILKIFCGVLTAVISLDLCTPFPHKWTSDTDNGLANASVTIQSRHYETVNRNVENDDKGRIYFPEELEEEKLPTPPVCKGSTYCEDIANYPGDVVQDALRKNEGIKYLAGTDYVPDVVQRIDLADSELCVSSIKTIYPKSGETKEREWLFIVNEKNFQQGVSVETCEEEGSECKLIDGFAEGYRTFCKQKYIYRKLAAILPQKEVVARSFRFAASCCCHIKFHGNPLLRMGVDVEKTTPSITSSKIRMK